MYRPSGRHEEGMALLIAMIFLVAMGLLATYAASRVMNNSRHVDHYVDYIHAYEGIESGLASAKRELSNSGDPNLPAADRDGLIGVDVSFNLVQAVPT